MRGGIRHAMIIHTSRLSLETCTFEDDIVDAFASLVADPDSMKFIFDGNAKSRSESEKWFNFLLKKGQFEDISFMIAKERSTGKTVGFFAVWRHNDDMAGSELYAWLLPAFRGFGYAYEASSAILDYALTIPNVHRITGITHPENHKAIRCLNVLGMQFVGTIQLQGAGGLLFEITRN